MKNSYRIEWDTVYIETNNGDLIIDILDLPIADSIKGRWIGHPRGYGENCVMRGGVSKRTFLHRLIMNCPDNLFVDHIDGNTRNNRRSNLRIVTHRDNMNNLKNNRKERSGHENVYYDPTKKAKPWTVRFWDKEARKTVYAGRFETEQEAVNHRDSFPNKDGQASMTGL